MYSVDCESIEILNEFDERLFQVENCYMKEYTAINRTGIQIYTSRSKSLRNLIFNNNQNIQYLPVKIYKPFPEIVSIEAENCRIQEISQSNFRKLYRMKILKLNRNLITTIEFGTFSDNKELQLIDLSKN